MKKTSQYLKEVRKQYENYPYPHRNPNDEKKRLIGYDNQSIYLINHYCFNGSINLSPKGMGTTFRILIAGGGTGDAAIYYAEVLSNLNAEIVYVDMSKASSKIAKQRAKIRQLTNITWIHNSILNITADDLGKFDYIDCSGVLHHLSSPTDGLNGLKSLLKPDGAMNIMVYAQYGRTGVYQMQELMRRINTNEEDLQVQVDTTKSIISALPTSNWFEKSKELFTNDTNNDNGIFDLLLHTQDRAYTVPQLYEWIEEVCGFNIIEFTGSGIESKMGYHPRIYIKDEKNLSKIKTLPLIEQKAIAELLSGAMIKHSCFISMKKDTVASCSDRTLIPYIHGINNSGKEIADIIVAQPGLAITFTIANQGSISLVPTIHTEKIFRLLDGKRSIQEIIDKIDSPSEEVFKEFESIFNHLFDLHILLLKSKKFPKIRTITEAQTRVSNIYKNN
jgi:SAM-dependent methyltransferase